MCVSGNETNNTCALKRPAHQPQTTRKVALAPRRVCDSRGPGAASNERALVVDHPLVVPQACTEPCFSVHHPGRVRLFERASVCASSKRSRSLHSITFEQASEQLDLPACLSSGMLSTQSVKGLPFAPWFLVGVISAQVIRMWPRAWLVPSSGCIASNFPRSWLGLPSERCILPPLLIPPLPSSYLGDEGDPGNMCGRNA